MVYRRPKPIAVVIPDADRQAVLKAFQNAETGGRAVVDCYKLATETWQRRHQDHSREYAARQAIQIVLDSRAHKLVDGLTHGLS